ncbi:MAG: tetratricopeptide repeat protein, partial [Planctomycetes bacterium]|nr:tetratricopeptide repeat protein [Planctomycetota bacterium]
PHLVRGRTLEEAGDVEGARRAYTEALRAEPESADAQALFQGLSLAPRPSGPFEPPTSAGGRRVQEGSIH